MIRWAVEIYVTKVLLILENDYKDKKSKVFLEFLDL